MASPLSSSTLTALDQDDLARPIPESQRRKEKNKVVAASLGAVITSLTMTPFDVVKFRLQAQEPTLLPSSSSSSHNLPLFAPSHSSSSSSSSSTTATTRPSSNSPWPPPIASTSAGAQSKGKFEPRVTTGSLPASGGHASSSSSTASLRSSPIYNTSFNAPTTTSASATATLSLSPSTSHLTSTHPPSPSKHHLKGFWDAVYKIVKYEGASALWRGTTPALAMSVPGQVIYMVGYDWGRRSALNHAPEWAYTSRVGGGGRGGELKTSYLTGVPLVAGMISRTLVAILVSPIELLRTQLQSSHSTSSVSLTSITSSLLSSSSPHQSAWRGLGPTLWRDVPFSGIYWAGYEGLKRLLTGGKGMGEGWKEQGAWEEFRVSFVSGAGSGMIAATLTNPFDVIKTRRQALSTSTSSAVTSSIPTKTFPLFFDILKKEGWAGLMRGLTPRLAKVGPACGIMIGCYEGVGSWLE